MSTEIRRLQARIAHLEVAMQWVIDAYGDCGWAKSEMCLYLRKALASPPGQEAPKGLFDRLESEITQLHNTCGHYEREIANLRAALLPSGLPPVDAQGRQDDDHARVAPGATTPRTGTTAKTATGDK